MNILKNFFCTLVLGNIATASAEMRLTVPPLKKEQPAIEAIYKFDNKILVSTVDYSQKNYISWWHLNEEKRIFIPVEKEENKSLASVSGAGMYKVKALIDNDRIYLRFFSQPKRNKSILFPTKEPFKISANTNFTFMVFKDRVVAVPNSKNEKVILLRELLPKVWGILPRSIAAIEGSLILGYDRGEWGGSTYLIKIKENGDLEKAKLLLSTNVCAIDIDSKGRVWIASGLSHMVVEEAGLHYLEGKVLNTVVSQRWISGREMETNYTSPLTLPKSTYIGGMTINFKDEVVVVAPNIGILAHIIGKPFENIWKGDLHVSYKMPGYGVGSGPQGIVEKGNSLFVASRSLGVFRFELTTQGKYIPIEQIVLK